MTPSPLTHTRHPYPTATYVDQSLPIVSQGQDLTRQQPSEQRATPPREKSILYIYIRRILVDCILYTTLEAYDPSSSKIHNGYAYASAQIHDVNCAEPLVDGA